METGTSPRKPLHTDSISFYVCQPLFGLYNWRLSPRYFPRGINSIRFSYLIPLEHGSCDLLALLTDLKVWNHHVFALPLTHKKLSNSMSKAQMDLISRQPVAVTSYRAVFKNLQEQPLGDWSFPWHLQCFSVHFVSKSNPAFYPI